jgi:hypothetical protein
MDSAGCTAVKLMHHHRMKHLKKYAALLAHLTAQVVGELDMLDI